MQSSSMSVWRSAVAAISTILRLDSSAVSEPNLDGEKKIAAEAAAELVSDGMKVGLGTGSTVAHLLPALAARGLKDLRCVATSVATEQHATELGIPVEPFDKLDRLDIAIDGADQVAPDHWLVKGGGGAHTREKIVAAAAEQLRRDRGLLEDGRPDQRPRSRWSSAPSAWPPRWPGSRRSSARSRCVPTLRASPDDGVIADFQGKVHQPGELAARLSLHARAWSITASSPPGWSARS